MEDIENQVALEEESKDTELLESNPIQEEETKLGDVFKTDEKEVKVVPEAKFLEYKNTNKQLKRDLADLQRQIESGSNNKVISKDLKAIAEEHNIDVSFLQDFASAVKQEAEKDLEEKVSERLKPITDKQNSDRIEKIFSENFSKTIDAMPEFKDIANRDVIKTLALDPKNANKTFAQIIENAYGHLVTGKRTIESTKPQGGKSDTSIDFSRASRDSSYFAEIMADPQLKKKYNENLGSRNSL